MPPKAEIPGTVAVNLSPVQFGRDDLAETIHAILLETGLSPRRLEVEVTESTLMSDQTRGLHILRKLKAMGISVAMDDFGTGYSSLATLHAFPFDKIKLDQSFVKRLPGDAAAAAIVRTVLALGRKPRHARAGRRHRNRGAMAISRPAKAAPRARAICSRGRWPCRSCRQRSRPPRAFVAQRTMLAVQSHATWPIRCRRSQRRSVDARCRRSTVCWIADNSQLAPRGRTKVHTSVASVGCSLPATRRSVPRRASCRPARNASRRWRNRCRPRAMLPQDRPAAASRPKPC